MDKYISAIDSGFVFELKNLPRLTVEQIKEIDEYSKTIYLYSVKIYLYCYYDYPEFYRYVNKKRLNKLNKLNIQNNERINLLFFVVSIGNIRALKHLELCGQDIHYINKRKYNAFIIACCNGQFKMIEYLERNKINIYQRCLFNGIRLCNAYESSLYIYDPTLYKSEIFEYLENKFLYFGYSKICSICYKIKDDKFITCKNNHIVHLKCQQKHDGNRCLLCSSKYVI